MTTAVKKTMKVLAVVVFLNGVKKETNITRVERNADGSLTGTVKNNGRNVTVTRAKGKRLWRETAATPALNGTGVSDSWRND